MDAEETERWSRTGSAARVMNGSGLGRVLANTDSRRLISRKGRTAMARGRRNSNRRKTPKAPRGIGTRALVAERESRLPTSYLKACELGSNRQYEQARALYAQLEQSAAYANPQLRALIQNDLAVFAALEGSLTRPAKDGVRPSRAIRECMSVAAESRHGPGRFEPVSAGGRRGSAQRTAGAGNGPTNCDRRSGFWRTSS